MVSEVTVTALFHLVIITIVHINNEIIKLKEILVADFHRISYKTCHDEFRTLGFLRASCPCQVVNIRADCIIAGNLIQLSNYNFELRQNVLQTCRLIFFA